MAYHCTLNQIRETCLPPKKKSLMNSAFLIKKFINISVHQNHGFNFKEPEATYFICQRSQLSIT